jgi:hypothetical protein
VTYPDNLPEPKLLLKLLQSLAVLDAILSPEWEDRYYSFQSKWSELSQMAGIRNGCGDEVFFLFNEAGCYIKGFSHEYWNPDEGTDVHYDLVPLEFVEGVEEPAFSPEHVSFCFWYSNQAKAWQSSRTVKPVPNEELFLLNCLEGKPVLYQEFATFYYERKVRLSVIESIYDHEPITEEVLLHLNPNAVQSEIDAELAEIGYPS